MSADQQRIIQLMYIALQEGDYDTARNLVTKIDHSGHKKSGYKEILNLACRQGNIFRAMEVAPFRGSSLCEEEIRDCFEWAMKNKDIRNAVQCKKMLAEKFTPEEIWELSGLLPAYSMISNLIGIIHRHINEQDLLPEEVLTIHLFEGDVEERRRLGL
jgi:hypothetical protein